MIRTPKRPDPFAKERALTRARNTTPPSLANTPGEKFMAALMGDLRGKDGTTPKKGVDYFTPAEIAHFIATIEKRIRIPKDGDNGKDAKVDYDLVLSYVMQETATAVAKAITKLPKAAKPEKVDLKALVDAVLSKLPRVDAKTTTVDYLGIKTYIDKQMEAIRKEPRVVQQFTGGGATSIGQLRDVILDGVPQDAKGNYILTPQPGGSGSTYETPTGTIDGVNVTFTVSAEPKAIIYFGTTLFEGANGYSRSGLTITMPYPPTVDDQFKAVI